jgi:hypothetical protein
MVWFRWVSIALLTVTWCTPCLGAQPGAAAFHDDFLCGDKRWRPYFDAGSWIIGDGVLKSVGDAENSARVANIAPLSDGIITVEVRVNDGPRKNFGLIVRAQDDQTCLVMRYYDRNDNLELLRYEKGRVKSMPSTARRLSLKAGYWYCVKVAVIEDMLLARLWPTDQEEPDWQLRMQGEDRLAGRVGLIAQDATRVDFRKVRVASEAETETLRRNLAQEKEAHRKWLIEHLALRLEPTPLVERTANGPMRRVDLRTLAGEAPAPVSGNVSVQFGNAARSFSVKASDFQDGAYPLLVPEPDAPAELRVTFDSAVGKRLETGCQVKPARKWTFYMTPHTHYDIGYTHPQPQVIDRLTADMDTAQQYCRETADWPAESRYRWTVEVSGLVKNYVNRRSKEHVSGLMDWVRSGRVEICGFYLNMPTELVGHEEIIRCLYYAQELRRQYGITIDTAMINDVPGYAWALPELFVESGIRRVAFRANSIRGQFLWYRPGAVPRPFYWVGPEGSRLFVWYTDSYREGNFFRAPGLHENAFMGIIRQNEQAGCRVDDIQLRMGGDNLPPDINTSRNARAWNEKYLWPRVVVATNREYLELLEKKYGADCKDFCGDIPSWWAEGPASSALETGMNRLLHDRLVAAEAVWALVWLDRPGETYPRDQINKAYDKMMHFDEHTWGASGSISNPRGKETVEQWQWKAANAYEARRLTDDLYDRALRKLSESIPSNGAHSIAVWNTIAWPRTDVVEISLAGTPFDGAAGLSAVDSRTREAVPVQTCRDRKTAVFIARDVPPFGHVCFAIEPRPAEPGVREPQGNGAIENRFYRLTFSAKDGAIMSWYDKELKRELVDPNASYRVNQAIYETPIGGRDEIDRKRPVQFKRTAASAGRIVAHSCGPVFTDIVAETSIPTCPRIRQRVRLYNELKLVEIVNTVSKEERYEPEGMYFAFPFMVPSPDIRLQIAGATMRPGKDQLIYTCHDFYSIQQWADVAGDGFGIILAPLEAPIVVVGDLNVYKWADRLTFDKGHLYSFVMNNYWTTNFKAGQGGTLTFRYRLTSYVGAQDPIRATSFAWQPFYPLQPVPLASHPGDRRPRGCSALVIEGDPVVLSCMKVAEAGDAIIVRLLEQRGRPASCRLRLVLPGNRRLLRAYRATPVEEPRDLIEVMEGAVPIRLRANEIATVGLVPE